MKFTVEAWAPEYGAPLSLSADLEAPPIDPAVEVEPSQWKPLDPESDPVRSVAFVDGVRRVDANVWIEGEEPGAIHGVCATYAAGVVRCETDARIVDTAVERGVFTSAPGAVPIVTPLATYDVRPAVAGSPEELWIAIQKRMGELEGALASRAESVDLLIVDGPLSHSNIRHAVGYIKTHRVAYLPPALQPVMSGLQPGQRTPMFLVNSHWANFSWYSRLPGGSGSPMSGVVRCEIAADLSPSEAAATADLVTATLPGFASESHKDPRAPHNLYPVGGLERKLRSLLGDGELLYRALRQSAAA